MRLTVKMYRGPLADLDETENKLETLIDQELRDDCMVHHVEVELDGVLVRRVPFTAIMPYPEDETEEPDQSAPSPEEIASGAVCVNSALHPGVVHPHYITETDESGEPRILAQNVADPFLRDPQGKPTGYREYEYEPGDYIDDSQG